MRKFIVNVNGASYEVEVEEITAPAPSQAQPTREPAAPVVPVAPAAPAAPAAFNPVAPTTKGKETVAAPMPGTILEVNVKAGDTVKSGDVLFILEAMKLENEIMAPCDGSVSLVNAVRGASVNSGDVLCVIA